MKQPMKLNPTEYETVVWHWTLPIGQKIEDMLEPSYWQHVTMQLRPGHEIKVAAEDRTMWAHLFVRSVGKREAVVSVIHSQTFGKDIVEQEDDTDTFVKWRGPKVKFGVFRKSDNECLHDGFDTKEDAYAWAVNREKGMAA